MKNPIKNLFKKKKKQKCPDRDLLRRIKIVNHFNIDTLFDIGANDGQYAIRMRELGYQKKIISFEPVRSAFENLKIASNEDDNWIVNNYALGSEDSKSTINVSGNSMSSSFLNMLPMHLKSAPESLYVAREEIEIKKLDSIFDSFCNNEDNIFVKIDTQGFEKNVLDGANKSLNSIKILQLEMSVLPLYENELIYTEMIRYLDGKGFQLYSLENGFSDLTTGQLLQVDGIFVQKALADTELTFSSQEIH